MLFKEGFVIGTTEKALVVSFKLPFCIAIQITEEICPNVLVLLCNPAIWMRLHVLLCGTNVRPNQTRMFLEFFNATLVIDQWASHTSKSALYMEVALLIVIVRGALYLAVKDEGFYILVKPIKQRIDSLVWLFFCTSALGRLIVPLGSCSAF